MAITKRSASVAVLVVLAATSAVAQFLREPSAKNALPPGLSKVGIDQRLNEQVPLDLQFKDEQGRAIKLGDYFHAGRPVIISLVYYNCPMLCGEVLNGMSTAFRVLKFTPGKEYEVVTLSIDPREKPELAAAKKRSYIEHLDRPGAEAGWHFLTGEQPQIDALADAIGWHYQYDPKIDQFAHAAGIVLVTPHGQISQYYYGVEFSARDMRLGIIEASSNHIGSLADQVLLYCYHYDPRTGKYGAVIYNIVRLAGGATVMILGSFLVMMFRRDKTRDRKLETGRA
ncbi:MAG: SCO family protein [Candidatus Korobacteraceae bacterium]